LSLRHLGSSDRQHARRLPEGRPEGRSAPRIPPPISMTHQADSPPRRSDSPRRREPRLTDILASGLGQAPPVQLLSASSRRRFSSSSVGAPPRLAQAVPAARSKRESPHASLDGRFSLSSYITLRSPSWPNKCSPNVTLFGPRYRRAHEPAAPQGPWPSFPPATNRRAKTESSSGFRSETIQ